MASRAAHPSSASPVSRTATERAGPADRRADGVPASAEGLQQTVGNRAFTSLLRATSGTDELERQADLIAGESATDAGFGEPEPFEADRAAAPVDPGAGQDVTRDVDAARAGGEPLPAGMRAVFEPMFGADLSPVRVHADAPAHRLTRTVNAEAFTSGTDIFFRQDRYQPGTAAGRSLLAHELAHVLQQRGAGPGLQRKPTKRGEIETLEYSVDVPASVQTMEEVFRLYERTAFGRETHSEWTCGGGNCDVAKRRGRRVKFLVERRRVEASGRPEDADRRQKAKQKLGTMSGPQRTQINDEVNRRYSELTGAKPSTKIKPSETGNVRTWENQLAEVVGEAEQLEKLPPAVKELLTGGDKPLPPKDFPQFLRIAGKLATLSEQDLAAFKLLAVRGTTDINLFEKSVDLFIARKAELVKALEAQQPKQGEPESMQAALDERMKGLDERAVATMSESDRYDLARKMTSELTEAQLKYMKDHPGETLKDFAKSATLVNTPETFKAIGQDLAEAANGDANSWARWAAGTGAGAKISGWLLAVAGVLYVASWLTGVGELVTIAAGAAVLLGTTITLSAVESELRIKAASQAKDPAEFKRHIQAAAAARANVIVSVGMIVIAAVLHVAAKAAFPKTMQRISRSMAAFRERIRLKGSIRDLKPSITAEVTGYRTELGAACESAKADAIALSKEVGRLSTDEFVQRLKSGNGDFLDHTKLPKNQQVDFAELAKSPEGRAAIEEYRQRLADALAHDVPAELDAMRKEYSGKIDKFLADVDGALTHEELQAAVDAFEPSMAEEGMKSYLKGRQDAVTAAKVAQAQAALEKEALRLKQAGAPSAPGAATTAAPGTAVAGPPGGASGAGPTTTTATGAKPATTTPSRTTATPPPAKAPATAPPTTEAPATAPPAPETPATAPPATQTPATAPPATETPATAPPATQAPGAPTVTEAPTTPPATEAPTTAPPTTDTPATAPPTTGTPATTPPTPEPPTTAPPVTEAPTTAPPVTEAPTTAPAAGSPPTTAPPAAAPEPARAAPSKAPAAGRTQLPPGVNPGKLRLRALELIDKLPEADRQRIVAALGKLPPAEAGRILTELGKLNDAAALQEALAERQAPKPEKPEGPAQPSSALGEPAEAHIGDEPNLSQFENRPPPRVSDTQPGVSRAALKGRMQPPPWASGPGDWNPHHMIPVSLETHPVLETLRANGGWDNNAPRNGYALPTRPGIPGAEGLPVHQVTPEVVRGAGRSRPSPQTMRDLQGHPVWNEMVRQKLDALKPLMESPAELRTKVEALLDELRHEIDTAVANGKPVLF